MSDRPKDGGPAFPVPSTPDPGSGNPHPIVTDGAGYAGMSLRDWFAGQALVGMAHYERSQGGLRMDGDYGDLAAVAYGMADAMLAEREKTT